MQQSQYQPVNTDEQRLESLERGATQTNDNSNSRQTNMNLLGGGTAWHEEAERLKYFRKKYGIPMPPHPAFRPRLCIRWLLTVVAFWYIMYNLIFLATEQRTIMLHDVQSIDLKLANCDILAIKTEHPILTVQHWKFLGSASHHLEHNGTFLKLSVSMRTRLPMFRCLVTVSVPRDHFLGDFHANMFGQELSRMVLQVAPARHVNMTFNEGYMEAKALPMTMHVIAQTGKIELAPVDNVKSFVYVKSKHAVLSVLSQHPIAVAFAGNARAHSILRGPAIKDKGDHVLIGTENASVPQFGVHYDTDSDCAGYFQMVEDASTLKTLRGKEQDADTPYLTNRSIKKIQRLSNWIKDVSDTTSPWVARIRLEGPTHSKGSWQAMSSEAFLAIPLELLVLLSAGSLKPQTMDATVQILSAPHEYWSKGELHNDPEDKGMWDIFHILEPYINVAEGKTIAWYPDVGSPIIFSMRGEKWTAHYHDVFKKQTLLFWLAFVLNVVASCSVAMALVVFTTRNINTMSQLNEGDLSISSSHRTYRQAISSTGWRVMATQIDWPEHAILLRWRKQTGIQLAGYFWITAESLPQGLQSEEHKVVVERVRASRVPAMKDHSVILEFLFHIRAVRSYIGAETPHIALRYQHSYRFQVEGYDNDVNPISKSEYSNEVYVTPRSSVVTLPFLVLKTFFPVPTSSLAFFLDNYSQKLIDGKIPQQVVILSEMTVTYHKNFRDFPEASSLFYVSAYMGRKDRDHQECKAQTQRGRCITYDRTEDFQPPWRCYASELQVQAVLGPDDDDKEKDRTQDIPGQLKLGSIDRECREVTFNLRISQSDDDVAEGVLTWDDLMEQFEETEQDEDRFIQAAWVDLKTDKNVEYAEEYLVYFLAKVSFGNTIDPQCKAFDSIDVGGKKDFSAFFFQKDSPGQIFYHGMERFVTWDSESDFVRGMETFDLYAVFPDQPSVQPKLVAQDVKRKSVGVTFMVDFPYQMSGCYATCQLQVRSSGKNGQPIIGKNQNMVLSHRFLICRTWTLAEMELMYASFCKMNNMNMQNLTTDLLEQNGISTSQVSLKTIPHLRRPIQFEEGRQESELIQTPGMFCISSEAIRAKEGRETGTGKADSDTTKEGSIAGDSTAASSKRASFLPSSGAGGTRSDSGGDAKAEEIVFHAKSLNVEILENIWPLRFGMMSSGYGTNWVPSFLLMYGFYPVDNILEFFQGVCIWLKFPVYILNTLTSIMGAKASDSFVDVLFVSPMSYVLPFLAEMTIFLYQLTTFLSMPTLLLIIALIYEYLMCSMHLSFEIVIGTNFTSTHVPDVVFRSAISGRDISVWWEGLNLITQSVLVVVVTTVCAITVFVFEANLCRNSLPWWLQDLFSSGFNAMAATLVGFYGWVGLSFLVMIGLWFVMAVVIYPTQMLGPLAGVAALFVLVYTMIVKDRATKEQIKQFLRDEIPEILDLLCTTYLEDYEKKEAARMVSFEQTRQKTNSSLWNRMQDHLKAQLIGERYAPIRAARVKDASEFVHYVFDHSLMKQKRWDAYGLATGKLKLAAGLNPLTDAVSEPSNPRINSTGAVKGAGLKTTQFMSGFGEGSDNEIRIDLADIKHTDVVLTNLGLAQTDTSEETHFDFRTRLMDKETESGGECVHIYSKELRQKLMSVFVRALDYEPLPDEVQEIFAHTSKFATAMFRAHTKKLKLFERRTVESEQKTLLQLLIQENHLQKMRHFFLYIAEHLDNQLDPKRISETVTPFVERWIPDEINRHLRLIFDKHSVGSQMQTVFESLRRWRSGCSEEELKEQLTLVDKRSTSKKGVLQMLVKVGLLDERASRFYICSIGDLAERSVMQFKRDDVSENAIDSGDLEEFIEDLVKQKVWWGAMKELLRRIGFPILPRGENAGPKFQPHSIPEKVIMEEFEQFAARKGGFLPASDVIDFLIKLTDADKTDGCAGRIWKAQMIGLMRHVGICGHVNLKWKDYLSTLTTEDEEESSRTTSVYNLSSYVNYQWPGWLETAWNKIAPEWTKRSLEGGPLKPFIPKLEIHRFFREIAFSEEAGNKADAGLGDQSEIDDTYDNWYKGESSKYGRTQIQIWQKRKKEFLKIRGIWHECFLAVLDKMDNGIDDETQQVTRFGDAITDLRDLSVDGLIDVQSFYDWVKERVVKDTKGCSKAVFHQVLIDANVTLPTVVADALWIAADKSDESSSLSLVRDLEDRVVMYFAKGLSYESVRTLIYDELQVPLLQEMDESEIKAAFTVVDDKTGQCGFLEPQEVQQMIRILTQQGMSMKMLLELFSTLKITFPSNELKAAFMMMDTNADDIIDIPEFLGLIDHIIVSRVPELLYEKLNMKIQQIAIKLFGLMLGAATIFLFIAIAMGAFQVEVAKGAAGMGASLMRAGIAIVAVLGLRRDAGDDDQDKVLLNARNHLYEMMGVSNSQMEARRKTQMAQGVGKGDAMQLMKSKKEIGKAMKMKGLKKGRHKHADDDDDDDDDDD